MFWGAGPHDLVLMGFRVLSCRGRGPDPGCAGISLSFSLATTSPLSVCLLFGYQLPTPFLALGRPIVSTSPVLAIVLGTGAPQLSQV